MLKKTRRKGRGAIIILELRFEARYHRVPDTKTWEILELTTIMEQVEIGLTKPTNSIGYATIQGSQIHALV